MQATMPAERTNPRRAAIRPDAIPAARLHGAHIAKQVEAKRCPARAVANVLARSGPARGAARQWPKLEGPRADARTSSRARALRAGPRAARRERAGGGPRALLARPRAGQARARNLCPRTTQHKRARALSMALCAHIMITIKLANSSESCMACPFPPALPQHKKLCWHNWGPKSHRPAGLAQLMRPRWRLPMGTPQLVSKAARAFQYESRMPQEAPGSFRWPQEAPGCFSTPQGAPGGPRRPGRPGASPGGLRKP